MGGVAGAAGFPRRGRANPMRSAAQRRGSAGTPQRFFPMLRTAGLNPIEHPFPDHHRYRPGDLQFGDALPIIMTEKDAVKCQAFAPARCWYLPVTAHFTPADERALLGRILMD